MQSRSSEDDWNGDSRSDGTRYDISSNHSCDVLVRDAAFSARQRRLGHLRFIDENSARWLWNIAGVNDALATPQYTSHRTVNFD